MDSTRERVRILSLDGGGIRSMISASVLVEIERKLRERDGDDARLADYFDLVAGTSAGGMLAAMLLLPDRNMHVASAGPARPKMSADEILDFQVEFGPKNFELSIGERIKRLGGLIDERYSSAGIGRGLDHVLGPAGSEPTLAELLKPTVIPTFRASTGQPYFFKQHEATAGGRNFSLRDVALATSAAPTYFEPPIVHSDRDALGPCVDGGVVANNPAMCAVTEAHSAFGVTADRMAMLSIGTGAVAHHFDARSTKSWGFASGFPAAFQMMSSGSSIVVDRQVREAFEVLGGEEARRRYLRLNADLSNEPRSISRMDTTRRSDIRRLVDIGRTLAIRHAVEIDEFIETQLVDRPAVPARVRGSVTVTAPRPDTSGGGAVEAAGRPEPTKLDRWKIDALVWVRRRNQHTVDQGSVDAFRRRHVPTSAMPPLERVAAKYDGLSWAPTALMAPARIPPEGKLPLGYKLAYYFLASRAFRLYRRLPIDPDVPWRPDFPWNREFPPTGDGWEHPTSDETFTRLRLQGPNPWLLHRVEPSDQPTFEVDFSRIFAGVLPDIRARFVLDGDRLAPSEIVVGTTTHRPGDDTWDRAKRVVNGVDARYVAIGKHLLEVHLVVGQAFALATFRLPSWHRLRPFMQFFTYATMAVNDIAYRSLLVPGSYFVESGFITARDVAHMYDNMIADFDIDRWLPASDIANRGIDAIPGHPYVDDADLVWPEFVSVVERHLDDIGLDDAAILADTDLQSWYLTLASLVPNIDVRRLDRARLVELCTILLWNNVVHEVAGDLSPILGSEDPADKSILHLGKLRDAIGDGELTAEFPEPTVAEVFLMDQASFVSRFNVGGNNILSINAARFVDDPRLREAIEDLQTTLRRLEAALLDRNRHRTVRFARMLPRHWEASISF